MKRGAPTVDFVDRPPAGWFVVDVMKKSSRGQDWVALMIDEHPDDFRERRSGARKTSSRWFRIPGKHRSRDAAWNALENAMATRH